MARKILLADDSVTAQNMGRKILTDGGYEVVTVNNGSAALKKVAEAQPELIVLDVYMPGYSGLEVCQRIKDSRETAHIPVLLTVGKLEPFKQDEARRVRADAFIIKPFEASELMAAVAKLESKLATAPPPRKEGRGSGVATMESFERTATATGPRYGDEESGWKARIKFPTSERKPSEPEPEVEPEAFKPAAGGAFRELISERPPASSTAPAMPDRPIPAGLPQDITPEEIAAIAAAAARVKEGISVGKNFARLTDETPASAQPQQEPPATAESPTAMSAASSPAELVAESTWEAPSKATSEETSSGAAAESTVPEVVIEPTPGILSLAVGLQTSEPTLQVAGPTQPSSNSEPVTVAVAGPVPEISSVPAPAAVVTFRWMAEEVPVEASESALVLEREMHKAFAAFAAADHGCAYQSAPVDREDEPMFATMAPPAIGAPLPMMETAEEPESSKDEAKAEEPAGIRDTVSTAFHDMPSAEVSKPPAPPFAPAPPAHDDSDHGVVAFGTPALMGGPEADAIAVEQTKSAEPATVENRPAPVSAESRTPETSAKKSAEPVSKPNPDLAASTVAAWANWREVRDSVLGPRSTAEAVQPEAGNAPAELEELKKTKALKKEEPVPPARPENAMAAAASADASTSDPNLSSIVDNMLAELKPKLMAELAEKLKKEKGKK